MSQEPLVTTTSTAWTDRERCIQGLARHSHLRLPRRPLRIPKAQCRDGRRRQIGSFGNCIRYHRPCRYHDDSCDSQIVSSFFFVPGQVWYIFSSNNLAPVMGFFS